MMTTVTSLLNAVLLVAIGFSYHKLSSAIESHRHESRRHTDNALRQIEGLFAVEDALRGAAPLPRSRGWAASPDFLHALLLLAEQHRPGCIVECSSGYSTLVLAAHCRRTGSGRVVSLEHDPLYAQQTRRLLSSHGLEAWATVVDAPLVDRKVGDWQGRWYDTASLAGELSACGPIQMLVVDGPPEATAPLARYPALPVLSGLMDRHCVVVMDDADRPSETRIVARWTTESPQFRTTSAPPCEKGCAVLVRES